MSFLPDIWKDKAFLECIWCFDFIHGIFGPLAEFVILLCFVYLPNSGLTKDRCVSKPMNTGFQGKPKHLS